jgi:GTP1/Obg family GTP-binding protein
MFDYTKYKYNFKKQEETYLDLIKDHDTDEKRKKLISELSNNVFDYLKYINKLIYEINDFDKFYLASLEKIVDKLKFDFAQGDFIDTLISIGKG